MAEAVEQPEGCPYNQLSITRVRYKKDIRLKALKGRDSIAQGSALGGEEVVKSASPERAEYVLCSQ
ncbi:MAG: hypothetical protein L0229_02870 [Blastocatellia bacterium]|nr:hypothetical protein [Blastocatellia bacterium]